MMLKRNESKRELLYAIYGKDKIKDLSDQDVEKIINEIRVKEVTISELKNKKDSFLVDSPDGFVPVKSLIRKGKYNIYEVEFDDGEIIKCSEYHMFQTHNEAFVSTVNLVPNKTMVIGKSGTSMVTRVNSLGYEDYVYDLAVDHTNHRYYTGNKSSHNSGAGKSVFLQNQAVNWAQQGLHVVYITLELSENLCAMRLDAMVTGVGTRDILKNIDDVAMRVKSFKTKNKGSIRLKQLPNGCTANDIRAFVKEIEVQTGIKADAVVVDYLDLMMPNSARVSPSDMFVKDKYVSEELRNLAIELNVLLSTASQLNRGSYDAVEYDPSNISGGISKVNTADNVMGIFTSAAMRESGRYQIQFMKTRSSSGVGKRVDLAFDPATLRIYDLPEGALDSENHTAQSVLTKMRVNTADQQKKASEPCAEEIRQKTTSLRDIIRRKD